MEWLSGAFNGTMIAAMVGVVIVAIYHALNPTPTPISRWRLWAGRATLAGIFLAAFALTLVYP